MSINRGRSPGLARAEAAVTQWVFFQLCWFPGLIHSAATQTSVLELFSRRFRDGNKPLKNGRHEYAVMST